MIDKHEVTAVIQPLGIALAVIDVQVTLDESWSPYCQVALRCGMPSAIDRELLDLRDTDLRLDLTLSQLFGDPVRMSEITAGSGGSMAGLTTLLGGQPIGKLTNLYYETYNPPLVLDGQSRSFDLMVTNREFDDETQEMRVLATSDESLLLGDANVTTSAIDMGSTSLMTIAAAILLRYGATLAAGSVDGTVAEIDATFWQPGQGAAAFVNPLFEAASLRLWCDEHRVWRTSERQSITPGNITIKPGIGGTMTGHRDTMTLAEPEVWFDAVVIEYRWVDDLGVSQVGYDVAGENPAKSVLHLVRSNTIYPGPGAAAGMIARAAGRGRVLAVTAINDYRATPGMSATIEPPDTLTQSGYLGAVAFGLPGAEMSVTTRGLTEIPPESYLYGDVGDSYLDVPAGIKYDDFDWGDV